MQSIKRVATRTAMAVALGATVLAVVPSSASATEAQVQYWTYKCDDGRACVYHTDGNVWNIEGCGVSGLNDYYNYAKAHGNSFRIFLTNGPGGYKTVDVPAWTEASLPSDWRAYRVQVFC
ncbi:hypothetical protein [Streptomyces galbus]|uniref:Peptidase inhibitor family I36 protein n=1 Tax=Streptomyces galbus TaxID=33898 RepID=A0A4U5W621_STRGB|nr:hypothetical protein [Streptomyces galbus]TKS96020.1 hypothetical protein E4U92_34660 [Streptomyces galbus]GHD52095.1 hypothetical protein GCM10010335_64090 [Streptomyces galbus]